MLCKSRNAKKCVWQHCMTSPHLIRSKLISKMPPASFMFPWNKELWELREIETTNERQQYWAYPIIYSMFHLLRLRLLDDYFWVTFADFESSNIFSGIWGTTKNWLQLKIEPKLANLACPNRWNKLCKNHRAIVSHILYFKAISIWYDY